MTLRSQGFYVTLPSNASLNVFKNNTSSSFREDLAQYLHLDGPGRWLSLKLPIPIHGSISQMIWHTLNGGKRVMQSRSPLMLISKKYFFMVSMRILTCWDHRLMMPAFDVLNLIFFSNITQFRKSLKLHLVEYIISESLPLAYMLGVTLGVWLRFERKFALYPADMTAGCYHFFCYSDIVTP